MSRRALSLEQWTLGVVIAATCAAGVYWGTSAVGGSDSSCYALQAQRFAAGQFQVVDPLVLSAPWPDSALTLAPAGHIPSPTLPGAAVPMCPVGVSLVMAPLLALGGPRAMFLVVPLFGALLVVATWMVGARFSPAVGLASALVTACSPAFLFQLFQPMSDVPAAALWLLAVAMGTGAWRHGPVAAGLVVSGAILVRPNLLQLGIVIGVALALRPERSWRERGSAAARYAAACAPGCLAVALVQQAFYGSPLQSGYGSLEALFSWTHVVPNAQRYAGWMWQTHTPLWLLALLAPLLLRGWLTLLLASLVDVNVAGYLPYTVFDDWWYLRFLLPAIPLVLVLMLAAIHTAVERALSGALRGPAKVRTTFSRATVAVTALVLAVLFVREARDRQAFDLARLESRFVRAGTYVAQRLPANAFIVTSWQSGSVRFYAGRPTLAWDGLDPAWLDRAVAFARAGGLEPYLLFERWEERLFRERFATSPLGALDWPPAVEIASQVRIYRPDDRQRYRAGKAVPTEYAR